MGYEPPLPSKKPLLALHDLADRHRGVTDAVAAYYSEAARVCLDRHHASPVDFHITKSNEKTAAAVEWKRSDGRAKAAHANETDATEAGAYACALAAVELAEGMVAVHRAETKTGADYYVAPVGHDSDDLENCFRLEISGVDSGTESLVAQRLRTKVNQAAAGASNLPALASVVGFKSKLIMIEEVPTDHDLG